MLKRKKDKLLKLAIELAKRENRDVLGIYNELKRKTYKMYNSYIPKNKKWGV